MVFIEQALAPVLELRWLAGKRVPPSSPVLATASGERQIGDVVT
jgi:hypothetical protein